MKIVNEIAYYLKAVINLQVEGQNRNIILARVVEGISWFLLKEREERPIRDIYYNAGIGRLKKIYPGLEAKRI